jgi:hypothetical protein
METPQLEAVICLKAQWIFSHVTVAISEYFCFIMFRVRKETLGFTVVMDRLEFR